MDELTTQRRPWKPDHSTPWLGDVLLGAVGAVHGELPQLRLAPPGGPRLSSGHHPSAAARFTPEQQRAAVNPDPHAARDHMGFPGAKRAVVVVVDGLGWHNLHDRASHAPFLTAELAGTIGKSTLPSTTAANLTFLGTGVQAGQTAMGGYTVRNPATGGRMNLISWHGGPDPLEWQRVPTIFERLAAAGARGAHVSTWRFEQSALTQAALRGAHYVAAESLPERVDATVQLAREGDTSLTYLYWSDVDAIGHLRGWQTPEWAEELSHVDGEIARLTRLLPPGTLVVVTADHGMVDVPGGTSKAFGGPARVDISAHPELAAGLTLVAGENRFLHLFTDEPESVAARWRGFFGERAIVRLRKEMFIDDAFGPVRPDAADLFGDVMVMLLGDMSVHDLRVVSEAMFNLPGLHGSVTEWERAVPILSTLT